MGFENFGGTDKSERSQFFGDFNPEIATETELTEMVNKCSHISYADLDVLLSAALNGGKYAEISFIKKIIERKKKLEDTGTISDGVTEPAADELKQVLDRNLKIDSDKINYMRAVYILIEKLYGYYGVEHPHGSKGDPNAYMISPEHTYIDIRDAGGNTVEISPDNIYKYQTTIVSHNIIGGIEDRRFYIFKDGQFEEIVPCPDRLLGNTKIVNIDKIGDYYKVTLGNDYSVNDALGHISFIVDYNGDYVQELGPQSGNEIFEMVDSDHYSTEFSKIYKYIEELEEGRYYATIFNQKMEKLGGYDTSDWCLEYCNDEICLCFSSNGQDYKIFCENQLIREGSVENLKYDFEGEEYLVEYFQRKEKEGLDNELTIESKRKCNCVVTYDEEKKALIITNYSDDEAKRRTLYSTKGVIKSGDEYIYKQLDKEYSISIENEDNENKIVCIRITGKSDNSGLTLFVNKDTGRRYSVNTEERMQCKVVGNLIWVFSKDGSMSKVFNQNFDYLGRSIAGNETRAQFPGIEKEVNGKIKYYIASIVTGEIITEIKPFTIINDRVNDPIVNPDFKKFEGGNRGPEFASYIQESADGCKCISVHSDEGQRVLYYAVKNIMSSGCRLSFEYSDNETGNRVFLVVLPDGRIAEVSPN